MAGVIVEKFSESDLPEMIKIWNEIVEAGEAFPQEELLGLASASEFFASQSYCAVAKDRANGAALGLYILHPNNIGRCGHICNASYAVSARARGKGIGHALVLDSLERAKELGFRIMQFNAVVAENAQARHLYEKLGFQPLGLIEEGFHSGSGAYRDICLYWRKL